MSPGAREADVVYILHMFSQQVGDTIRCNQSASASEPLHSNQFTSVLRWGTRYRNTATTHEVSLISFNILIVTLVAIVPAMRLIPALLSCNLLCDCAVVEVQNMDKNERMRKNAQIIKLLPFSLKTTYIYIYIKNESPCSQCQASLQRLAHEEKIPVQRVFRLVMISYDQC